MTLVQAEVYLQATAEGWAGGHSGLDEDVVEIERRG